MAMVYGLRVICGANRTVVVQAAFTDDLATTLLSITIERFIVV